MSVREQLVDMGFAPGQIEASLKNTSGTLEDAITWLEEHQAAYEEAQNKDHGINTLPESTSNEPGENTIDLTADNQSESSATSNVPKPLTDEEKARKLEELKEKARLRKLEEAKKDAEERRKNDAILKKQTKETREIIEEQKQKEAVKEAARRRQQAREDALARKKIKDQIEADKRARKAEQEARKAGTKPLTPAAASSTSSAAPKQPKEAPTESKMRFRVQGVSVDPFMEVFPVTASLGDVAEKVGTILSAPGYSLVFMTTFPTKTFSQPDFGSTLQELGLINTNVIVKPTPII